MCVFLHILSCNITGFLYFEALHKILCFQIVTTLFFHSPRRCKHRINIINKRLQQMQDFVIYCTYHDELSIAFSLSSQIDAPFCINALILLHSCLNFLREEQFQNMFFTNSVSITVTSVMTSNEIALI